MGGPVLSWRPTYSGPRMAGRGVDISKVQQLGPRGAARFSLAFFEEQDGNTWAIQEAKRLG
jgi:hypothetical protein